LALITTLSSFYTSNSHFIRLIELEYENSTNHRGNKHDAFVVGSNRTIVDVIRYDGRLSCCSSIIINNRCHYSRSWGNQCHDESSK
jgi:hypothetical protein